MVVGRGRRAGLVVDTVCTDRDSGKAASEQEQARHSAADQYAGSSGRLTPRRTDTALSVNTLLYSTQLVSSSSDNNIHDRLPSVITIIVLFHVIPTSVDFASVRWL